jgi:glutathione S-transferase
MPQSRHVVLHHAPQTRSFGVLVLLEELNADYSLHVLNLKANEQRSPAYLAINPMGKVPAIEHEGSLVTEQGAIYLYLADLYADAGLAPQMGTPLRGPYLRWLFFYGSSFEPAVVDRAMKHPPVPPSTCPYGDFDTMLKTLTNQLDKGPYLLGERFTAVDVLWGHALRWTTQFGLIPATALIQAYIERVTSRPASARITAQDAELIAAQVQ